MPLMPDSSGFSIAERRRFVGISDWFRGLFHTHHHFSPSQVLGESQDIDPRLKPKAPMNSDNIDPALMIQFRGLGFKHAQEITAASHPELYLGWQELCRRAGFAKPLQLIVTDSVDPNAIDASESEVVVSTGLLKMLNFREMLGVLGHELGHAKHDAKSNARPLIDGAGVLAGGALGSGVGNAVKYHAYGARVVMDVATGRPAVGLNGPPVIATKQPNMIVRGLLSAFGFTAMIGGALLGLVIAQQFAVRPSELRADREGVLLSGDPEALVSAFEKMHQMTANQPGWKKFFRYTFSGYPTFGQRIHRVKEAAAQIPSDQPPVYQMVEKLAAAPVPPEIEASARQKQTGPASRIGKVEATERVIYVPETSLLH